MPLPLLVWGAIAAAGAVVAAVTAREVLKDDEKPARIPSTVLLGPEGSGKSTIFAGLTGGPAPKGSTATTATADVGSDDGEDAEDDASQPWIRILDTPGGVKRLGDAWPNGERVELVVLVVSAVDLVKSPRPADRWCRHLRELADERGKGGVAPQHLLVVSHADLVGSDDGKIVLLEAVRGLRSRYAFVDEVVGDVRDREVVDSILEIANGVVA